MRIRPGLCSVTFRELAPAQIADAAARAGLEVVEWGGDVHVPPGDIRRATEVARATADAGLAVCSYGSYFRAGPGEEIAPILDAAEALGTDRIRVWAGRTGSAAAGASERAWVVDALTRAADAASARGMGLALEFHGGTLADDDVQTLRVLDEVGAPNLSTYWQPAVSAPDDLALAHYETIADRVSAVHVFSWWPAGERLPLRARDELWRRIFATATVAPIPPRDALPEFVPGGAPGRRGGGAAVLRRYLG